MKTVKVTFRVFDDYPRSVDVTNRLTGRWKVVNDSTIGTHVCLEVKKPGLLGWFGKTIWIREDWLQVDELEEFINEC